MSFRGQIFYIFNEEPETTTTSTTTTTTTVPSISLFTAANGGTGKETSIVIPASAAVGDLAVIVSYCNYNRFSAQGYSPSRSFIVASSQSETFYSPNQTVQAAICYKILTSGDPGSTVTGLFGAPLETGLGRHLIYIFKSTATITSINACCAQFSGTRNTDPPLQTLTNTHTGSPIIYLAVFGNSASSASDGTLSVSDGSYNMSASPSYALTQYKIYNSSPASSLTIDKSNQGSLNAQLGLILKINH